MRLGVQVLIVSGVAAAALAWQASKTDAPMSLWLTPDQQGRRAYEDQRYAEAAELFEDPMWKGMADYRAGKYPDAAEAFSRVPTAVGFFNRGAALMKAFEYAQAITAFELAVAEDPEWVEAQENLELARYTLDYIEQTRLDSDTGDESELGADEFRFDNTREEGVEITITKESTIELQSAEKWMRSVDTETREFLRLRFGLEAALGEER